MSKALWLSGVNKEEFSAINWKNIFNNMWRGSNPSKPRLLYV
ncbi:hypothetical protein [Apibacter sp. HY039]|nr:hypothetical protein [Apibacter sp. HY039]